MLELVIFRLANEYYGLEIQFVENIEKMLQITRVPYSEKYIKGVVNLRGNIIPVIDLRKKFNLEEQDYTEESRIIIVNHKDLKIGMVVDSSSEVLQLHEEDIDPAPQINRHENNKFIKQIGKHNGRIIMLLDLIELLGIENFSEE
jgi:purine-binding chemotaxis protein CheW